MRKNTVLEVYLALVSAVSLVIFAVSLSIVLSKTMDYFFVSWEEYKVSNRWYLDQPCKGSLPMPMVVTGKVAEPVEVDEECRKQNEKELKLQRQLEFKKTLINSLPVALIFLIIFWFHYKTLRAYVNSSKDIEVEK